MSEFINERKTRNIHACSVADWENKEKRKFKNYEKFVIGRFIVPREKSGIVIDCIYVITKADWFFFAVVW